MAIDPRISLMGTPAINVGQRYGQALQNIKQSDSIRQNRMLAPLEQQQAQMKVDLMKAAQPGMINQAQFANSGLSQEIATQEQVQQFDFANAQSLSTALNTGNPQIINNELMRQKAVVQQLVSQGQLPETELQEIDAAMAMVSQPGGLQTLSQGTNSFLQSVSGRREEPQTASQKDFGTYQALKQKADTTGDEGDVVAAEQYGRRAGFIRPTEQQKADIKVTADVRKDLLKQATSVSKDAFDQLKGTRNSISTMQEAIKSIDAGASSGFFDKFLPSFKESTIALENAAQRMGLDVISATTFGALSEGELKLAMDTAVPKNLQPKALKTWLGARIKAKQKLSRELSKMAIELGKGKTTIAEYLEKNTTVDDRTDQDILSDYGF